MFHDIGKLMIDKAILDKPSRLTDEEYKIMKPTQLRAMKFLNLWDLIKEL